MILPNLVRDPGKIEPSLRKAINEVIEGKSPWPLFVFGPTGTGKTCAALCLLDFAGGEFYSVGELCLAVIRAQHGRFVWRNGYGDDVTLYEEGFWKLIGAQPLVVLDDLGSREKVSSHHYDCVKSLLDRREARPTLITSNVSIVDLERVYDDRVASRLGGGTVVKLTGKDRRLKRKE